MTRLYAAKTGGLRDPALFSRLMETVPEERREKIGRLRKAEDKCLSLGAWHLLVHGLWQAGIPSNEIRLTAGDVGKPYLTTYPEVHFNLSHSGERVFCAVSDREVGCDVEQMKPVEMGIARRFFTLAEYEMLKAIPEEEERKQTFFRIWTLKESFIKAVGRGMTLPMGEFAIRFTENGVELEQTAFPNRNFFLREWDFGDGYRYACCAGEPDFAAVEWVEIGNVRNKI